MAALPPLSEWETFYVIIGSSAAALTGLMFVVIALSADTRTQRDEKAFRAFATPTIVHFCAVLLIGAFMSTPRHSVGSLRLCLLLSGISGLGYMAWVLIEARRQRTYVPELEDVVFHFALPPVAYALIFISGVILGGPAEAALYLTGGSALLLLFIGIHNAWDSAVWMTINRKKR